MSLIAAWLATWGLMGCSEPMDGVPESTLRIGPVEMTEGTELDLLIFRDRLDCEAAWVNADELRYCLPFVDRASGQVRLGIQFQLEGDDVAYPLPLTDESIEVYHSGFKVLPDDGVMRVDVIPHGPNRSSQLFILVIDGSGSMHELDDVEGISRIEKVRSALLMPEVVESFYREGLDNGVVLLNFTDGQPRPVGTDDIQVIKTPKRYRKLVRQSLDAPGGYTHLYDAVDYAATDLLKEPAVAKYIVENEAQPTIVVLTDGFNNETANDTCGTNAPRLTRLLEDLKESRDLDKTDIALRPTIYTVGLGKPMRRASSVKDKAKPGLTEVGPTELCGRFAKRRIDGDLERDAIDNASLIWIATQGGGSAYVRQDSKGLGKAFQDAAAVRYDWFEVRYQLDVAYLRRSFETKLRLKDFSQAESAVTLYPSAWLDGPPGVLDQAGWSQPVPFRSTAGLVMPLLGAFVTLAFLGAALYNVRRVAFGRVNPGRTVAQGRTRVIRAPKEPPPPPAEDAGKPGIKDKVKKLLRL